jgi:hypothetical protein
VAAPKRIRTGSPAPSLPAPVSRSGGPQLTGQDDWSALRFSPCRAAPRRNPGRNKTCSFVLQRARHQPLAAPQCHASSPFKTPLLVRGWCCASIRWGRDRVAEWQSLPTRAFELFHVLGDMSIYSIFNSPQAWVPCARVSCKGREGRGDRRIGGQPHDCQLQEGTGPLYARGRW